MNGTVRLDMGDPDFVGFPHLPFERM